MQKYEVILVLEQVKNKKEFDAYLKKEGFSPIENEEFAYKAKTDLPLENTRAYIFGVLKKYKVQNFICQLGTNDFEIYKFDEKILHYIKIN